MQAEKSITSPAKRGQLERQFKVASLFSTAYLQVLLALSYGFSFIMQAYLTRVLGASLYSRLFLADKLMLCFSFLLDGGFLLVGTNLLQKNVPTSSSFNSSLITNGISLLKLGIAGFCTVIFGCYCLFNPRLDWHFLPLYGLFFLATVADRLVPDFLYRAKLRVPRLLLLTFLQKLLLVVLVVLLVRSPADYVAVATCLALVALLNLSVVFSDCHHQFAWHLAIRPKWDDLKQLAKQTLPYMSMRIASAVFTGGTWLVLASSTFMPEYLGYFAVADLLITTGKKVMYNMADSLHAYIAKSYDWPFLKRFVCGFVALTWVLFCGIYYFAPSLLAFTFGATYVHAAPYLRCLLVSAALIVPGALVAYPCLGVLGQTQAIKHSLIVANLAYFLGILLLYLKGNLSLLGVAWLYNLANALELLWRLGAIYRYRGAFKENKAL